ncbi:hypothetical protein [Microbacterium sp. Root180]|uniref:hypothetical protein n=1 Tax=Microbacterium sp. Root180 TaxID=1736483 RepID=UPI000AAD2EFC|nr:hypothetical protein [Microbacterium sp. Root180]
MHEHIEILMAAVAAKLRRDRPRAVRKRGPRRARGTFVPVMPELPAARPLPALHLAH